jgi:hypothetical protein
MNLDSNFRPPNAAATYPRVRLLGLFLAPFLAAALSATDLGVQVSPGQAIVGEQVQTFAGRDKIACFSGETLADGSEVQSALVVHPTGTGKFTIAVVDGAAATAGASVAPTFAAITSAVGTSSWAILGVVTVSRTGSAITTTIDHTARPFDLDRADKYTGGDEEPDAPIQGGAEVAPRYKPWGRLPLGTFDAASIANGDVLTDLPLPRLNGRIRRWGYTVTRAISTGAKTATLALEIGSTAVTGSSAAVASTKALGASAAIGTITAAADFAPGDTLSIVASAVTAFTDGTIAFWADIDVLDQLGA